MADVLRREMRGVLLALDSGDPITRIQQELLGALRKMKDRNRSSASVSRHRAMTVTHTHSHDAHDHPADDLGEHLHAHTHNQDSDHDHVHDGSVAAEQYYSPPGPAVPTGRARAGRTGDGVYSQALNSALPADKAAARRALQAEHEARR